MDEKVERLKNWMKGVPDNPITVELNPTNRCNSKCLSCWLREFKLGQSEELSKEELLRIVKEASELNVKEFRIPGSGEPLTKPEIMEVLRAVKEHKMNGLLITNGTLLDENRIKELVTIGWDFLTISLDGPNPKTNDYLRGLDGYFEKVIFNLELLKKIKIKEKKEKPILRFNVVLSNKNYDRIQGIFELANKYDCKDVQIQTLTVWGEEGGKLRLNKGEMKRFQSSIKEIKKFAYEKGILTNIESFTDKDLIEKTDKMDEVIQKNKKEKNKFLNLPCFEPWYNMIILPNGVVAPCSISGGKNGDSLKNKSLRSIWFGENFNTLRQNLLNNQLPEYCKTCCVAVHIENQRIKKELKNA